jgi:hypothetical protein
MWRRFQIYAILVAWFIATGSQWDLIQSFGWARMFAGNLETMSFFDAAKATFAPEHVCGICQAVQKARQQEQKSVPANEKSKGKLLLVLSPRSTVVIGVPLGRTWPGDSFRLPDSARAAPLLPPPKLVV